MPGVVFRDPANALLMQDLVTVRNVTTTVTGSGVDMLTGDGRCALFVDATATSITAVTVVVQQSTVSNSGFANITGASVAITTSGVTAITFDRDSRYVLAIVQFAGTTAVIAAFAAENLKTF